MQMGGLVMRRCVRGNIDGGIYNGTVDVDVYVYVAVAYSRAVSRQDSM